MISKLTEKRAGLTSGVQKREWIAGSQGSVYSETVFDHGTDKFTEDVALPASQTYENMTNLNEKRAGLTSGVQKREWIAGSQGSVYSKTAFENGTENSTEDVALPASQQNENMTNLNEKRAGLTPRVNKREWIAGSQGSAYSKMVSTSGMDTFTNWTPVDISREFFSQIEQNELQIEFHEQYLPAIRQENKRRYREKMSEFKMARLQMFSRIGATLNAPFRAARQAGDAASEIENLAREARPLMTRAQDTLGVFARTGDSMAVFLEQGSEILSKISETLENAKTCLFGGTVSGVITKIFKILCNALMADRRYLCMNLLFNVSMEFSDAIKHQIQRLLGVGVQLQSFGDFINLGKLTRFVDKNRGVCAAGLGALLALILQVCLGLPTHVHSCDQLIKFFGDRSRGLKNVFDFANATLPMFTAIGAWLLTCQFGNADPELEEFLNGYRDWSEEILALIEHPEVPFAVRIEKDVKLVYQVDKLYKKSVEYAGLINTKGIRGPCTAHFLKLSKIVEEMRRVCDFTGVFGNRPRTKPVVIQLFGESGVGKSGMSWPLACDLNAAMSDSLETAKNFASEIYFRNVEQEFWDGYAGQNVVVYDDFGQRVDSSTSPNEEFMELIRAANLAPYPLHMADLPEKKRTKFCSRAIILTSNVLEQNVSSLTFPDAYRRRIDICGKVTIKPEFAKQCASAATGELVWRLDGTKCNGPIDTRPYLVQLYDPESQQPIVSSADGRIITVEYEAFLDKCLEAAKISFRNSQAVNTALSERLTEDRYTRLHAKMQSDDDIDVPLITDEMYLEAQDEVESMFTTTTKRIRYALARINQLVSEVRALAMDKVAETLSTSFTTRLSELMSIKNGIILAGLVIGGLGVWYWFGSKSKDTRHKSSFKVSEANVAKVDGERYATDVEIIDGICIYCKYSSSGPAVLNCSKCGPVVSNVISEASCSNDNLTRKTQRLITEANSSSDNTTKRAQRIITEATSSADCVTRKKATLVTEATASSDCLTKRPTRQLLEVCAAASGMVSGRKVVEDDTDVIQEGCSSGDARTRRMPTILTESADADMQAWKDASAQDLISHRIIANLYKIIRIRDGTETALLNGLFVRDTIMLVPRHILLSIRESDEIRIENALGAVFKNIPWRALQVHEVVPHHGHDKDAILVKFPRYVNSHSDLVKHFQTMPELSVRNVDVCVPTIRCINATKYLTVLGNTKAKMQKMQINGGEVTLNLRDAISYNLNTINGDCGAPVICQDNSFIRKIAGIHIAAFTDGTGCIGQSVTQKDLIDAIAQMTNVIVTDNDNLPGFAIKSVDLQHSVEYSTEDLVELLGSVAATFGFIGVCSTAPFAPNTSDIRPSVIHGAVTAPTTKPSKLWSHDVNILYKNMGKNAINTDYIDEKEVAKCVAEVEPLLLSNRRAELARVFTFEEAVAGSDVSLYTGGLNRASSAGFPWVLNKPAGTHGKTGWFGTTDYTFDENVKTVVEERIVAAKKGVRLPTVWTDTLKDERRPIEKVDAGKTRVFSNGPMDYTIAFRQYFLGFIAHIMENRIDNEQSLGTNPMGMDWTRTAKKLQSFGKKVFAGDFSSFDGTLNSCIMEHFVEVANKFYDDGFENATVRRVLFLDVFNSIHLCQGTYINLTHSQPSGNPATTALNSFYNSVSMRMAYYRCAKKAGVKAPTFGDKVSMVSYGDDNVVNFSDDISDWFNQEQVTEAYASFGMIYTDEAKSGNIVKWRQLSEVAYLKRSFRKDGPIYRAPLDLSTILELVNWIRKCPDLTLATQDNVEDACRELAQHERVTFDEYSDKLIKAFYNTTETYPRVYTYDSYNEEWNYDMGLVTEKTTPCV